VRPALHRPAHCATCQSFRAAVAEGRAGCTHAWERASGGLRCELCLNYRTVLEAQR